MYINGHLDILNQRARGSPQAALTVTSFGQLQINRGTRIKFINNTGVYVLHGYLSTMHVNYSSCVYSIICLICRLGAAISVESQQVTKVLSRLFYNPLCFLLYEEPLVSPDEWSGVRYTVVIVLDHQYDCLVIIG